jgi:hypothetical protein
VEELAEVPAEDSPLAGVTDPTTPVLELVDTRVCLDQRVTEVAICNRIPDDRRAPEHEGRWWRSALARVVGR